ncbi:hypothetical protein C2S53_009291 [Perilla frutescens var. hirtella]|uniref:Nuclear transcription factor Y subunit n=1 Tax=Perilla frutescens var. hirtella TaxID=608512 RepID=A0AAD4JCX7_PERFH|nr:hypothetical protein C2S51_012581 [Perilla frutescens var. frutescens]KAH6790825.1 hypothetical protein C2S51_005831 [Perilla frutescens var. frutescens]KAH6831096.1 hypothetical protein C2S53_009291 [Perilla frutescens var. hirtella]
MQSLSIKDSDRTTADSFPTLFGSRMSMWFSAKQPELSVSKSVATELETTKEHDYHVKLSESQYQEQDSSSTLSTGQSHHEGATSAGSDIQMQNVSFEPGSVETYKRREEDFVEPSLSCGNADYLSHQVQMENNQSSDWVSYSMAAPYFGRITTAYDPNAFVYPQMMGVAQARVVLPLDRAQGIPMFVNAKQYHAILRRRQTRAKLEAQNKVAKTRKPYLHESRHHHALRRARGSGGRFLNTKNLQQSKPGTQEPETQHSESSSWGTSTTSGSEVSCIFNNDNIFQQPDLRASSSSLTMGTKSRSGTHSYMMAPNDMLLLSIDRCAQIRSTT